MPLLSRPKLKINDSMSCFISYTYGMNAAIKEYIQPSPPRCPLIIDLWIIPNAVIDADAKHIDNKIGDIQQRLQRNKVLFITKKCKVECWASTEIANALQENNMNRVIFIIDRRYNKKQDTLYCIVPPSEYGTVINETFDLLNLSHWHCSSKYLLPSIDASNHGHIGSTTHCNGYMFNLSYLIYEKETDEEQKEQTPKPKQKFFRSTKKRKKSKLKKIKKISAKTENIIVENEKIKSEDQMKNIAFPNPQKTSLLVGSNKDLKRKQTNVRSEKVTFDDIDYLHVDDTIQRSTANVNVIFSTQSTRKRLLPKDITELWPKCFVMIRNQNINAFNKLFALNLFDPYLDKNLGFDNEIRRDLDYMLPGSDVVSKDINFITRVLSNISSKWSKISCQSNIIINQNAFAQIKLLETSIPSTNIVSKILKKNTKSNILVESAGHYRPDLNVNDLKNIYDAICYYKGGNIDNLNNYLQHGLEPHIADKIKSIKEDIIKCDTIHNGTQFMQKNESLLINDGIVPYSDGGTMQYNVSCFLL